MKGNEDLVGAPSPLKFCQGNIEMVFHPGVEAKVVVDPNETKVRVLSLEGKSYHEETFPLQENRDTSFLPKLLSGLGWMAGRFLLEWILKHLQSLKTLTIASSQ